MYEWGKSGDVSNVIVERIFDAVMALCLCCNLFLALFGAWYWIYSINMASPSHESYMMDSIKPVMFLHHLMAFTGNLVWIGLLLGVYLNLSPHLPETIVIIIIAFLIGFVGSNISCVHMVECAPLEMYHMPQIVLGGTIWFKGTTPDYWFSSNRMQRLTAAAKIRAERLRTYAYRDRNMQDPRLFEQGDISNREASLMGRLLRTAAANLNRSDFSTAMFEDRLEKDWLNKPEQLKGMSEEVLSRYMPLGLAREVQKLVEAGECTTGNG